jgi:uncharacterized protein YegL
MKYLSPSFFGSQTDHGVVVQLDTADSATIKSFFKWVFANISTGSIKSSWPKRKSAALPMVKSLKFANIVACVAGPKDGGFVFAHVVGFL